MKAHRLLLAACAATLFPTLSHAAAISINFSGGRAAEVGGFPLAPTDQAGNPNVAESFTSNWNNAPGASGTALPLVDNNGAATPVTITYSTDLGGWSLPNTTGGTNLSGGANPQMMRGYIDVQDNGNVRLSGLANYFSSYRVAIFFDGDNGAAGDSWRVARYTITDTNTAGQLFQGGGEDSEGEDFNSGTGNNLNGLFQIPAAGGSGDVDWPNSPNNNEGNFVITDLLTAGDININAAGTSNLHRAPINGIQIIGTPVPEPTSLALLGLAALPLARRRRR